MVHDVRLHVLPCLPGIGSNHCINLLCFILTFAARRDIITGTADSWLPHDSRLPVDVSDQRAFISMCFDMIARLANYRGNNCVPDYDFSNIGAILCFISAYDCDVITKVFSIAISKY